MTQEDLIWLVGFYEGEGSCGCYRKTCYSAKGKKYVYPQGALNVTIAQKDQGIIEWIFNTVGYGHIGHRIQKNPTSFGHELWYWAARSRKAEQFLDMIRPYVKIPRRQFQIDEALRQYREAHK